MRRLPNLPGRCQPSTVGVEGLNFCVRDGNRWDPFAIATAMVIYTRKSLSAHIYDVFAAKLSSLTTAWKKLLYQSSTSLGILS